jgi:hypothetical protein
MDRKILRLALVIAVSLFVGTVFTGCNDGEDASEPYLLKKEDIRVSQPEGGFAVVVDQLLKVRVESESDEGISCWTAVKLPGQKIWSICLRR